MIITTGGITSRRFALDSRKLLETLNINNLTVGKHIKVTEMSDKLEK